VTITSSQKISMPKKSKFILQGRTTGVIPLSKWWPREQLWKEAKISAVPADLLDAAHWPTDVWVWRVSAIVWTLQVFDCPKRHWSMGASWEMADSIAHVIYDHTKAVVGEAKVFSLLAN
jgi:hypothetical protein